MSQPTCTKEQVIDRFCLHGWERHHGFGVAANAFRESGFVHTVVGDRGHAYGLGQWHEDRQREFKRAFGKDIRSASWQEQIDFIHHELTHSEKGAGARLRQAQNARESAAVISRFYERPRDAAGEAQRRGDLAQKWFDDNQRRLDSIKGEEVKAKEPGHGGV